MEEKMLDLMFELPSTKSVKGCTITRDFILSNADPELKHSSRKRKKKRRTG
jgi:ATP-dependent protease Clp ATPase subunit